MLDLASFNSLAPELRDDPHPVYAALRKQAPAFWGESEQAWVLLGRHNVGAAFSNPDLLTLEMGQFIAGVCRALKEEPAELLRLLDMSLFFRNPPSHAPLRSLVAKLIASRSQASCLAAVERIAHRLIEPLAREGSHDLMTGFADPLPALFMGWLFGFSDEDSMWLLSRLAGVPLVLVNGGCSIRDYRAANRCLEEAHQVLREKIAERRRNPAGDGLSLLISLNDEAEGPLDDDLLAAITCFVFMGGFETTSALIGSSLWLLLSHPDEYSRVAANPDLISGVVNEALRLEAPIQQVRRRAKKDQIIAGCDVREGQQVILMIAAANRDPEAYPDPDRFMPERTGLPVLSFGGGLHHCLGAWLARMEAAAAISVVLKGRRPALCSPKPNWRYYPNQRRMMDLLVEM
jgi:cytochrome P450